MKKIIFLILTFISFLSVKNYPQSDSIFSYLPLDIGNQLQYKVYHIVFGPPQTDTTIYYSIFTVERDTIMPNGYEYKVISSTEFETRYLHIDSTTACVYEYENDTSRGLKTDSLRCSPGDWFGRGSHCEFIDTATVLGYQTWVMGIDRSWPDITVNHSLAMDIGITYRYKYESFGWGTEEISSLVYAKIDGIEYGTVVSVEDRELQPVNYQLSQNYPNPFNPITKISYRLPVKSFILLKVYDIIGNEIAILVNEEKQAETYEVEFNGAGLPSGIYFYRISSGSFIDTKKMLLIK